MNVLKKKKSANTDKLFPEVLKNIEQYVDRLTLAKAVRTALQRITRAYKEFGTLGYGWSGGKDGLVLHRLIELSGVPCKGLHIQFQCEWTCMLDYFKKEKPQNCETVVCTHNDLLRKPELLFPTEAKYRQEYNKYRPLYTHKWCKENNIKCHLLGRRTIDGNVCGKDGVLISKGIVKVCPIYDWSHEMVLAFIHYYKLKLPPLYEIIPDCWSLGTHCWSEQHLVDGDINKTLQKVYNIDPQALRLESRVPIIKQFLIKIGDMPKEK